MKSLVNSAMKSKLSASHVSGGDENWNPNLVPPNWNPNLVPPNYGPFIPPMQCSFAPQYPGSLGGVDSAGNMQSTAHYDMQKKYMDFLNSQNKKFMEMFGDKGTGSEEGGGYTSKKKPKRYCWLHGCCSHWGSNCDNPKKNHKKEATFRNIMGGSNSNCLPLRNKE